MSHNTGITTNATELAALAIDGLQPAWMTLNEARERTFTGEIVFGTDPEVLAYLDHGMVYYAERVTDLSLVRRLLDAGVLDVEQLDRGVLRTSSRPTAGSGCRRAHDRRTACCRSRRCTGAGRTSGRSARSASGCRRGSMCRRASRRSDRTPRPAGPGCPASGPSAATARGGPRSSSCCCPGPRSCGPGRPS